MRARTSRRTPAPRVGAGPADDTRFYQILDDEPEWGFRAGDRVVQHGSDAPRLVRTLSGPAFEYVLAKARHGEIPTYRPNGTNVSPAPAHLVLPDTRQPDAGRAIELGALLAPLARRSPAGGEA